MTIRQQKNSWVFHLRKYIRFSINYVYYINFGRFTNSELEQIIKQLCIK